MRVIRSALLSILVALSACTTGQTQVAARASPEVMRGRAYAEDVCAACHAIDKGATNSPNPQAPAFQAIANTPGMTRIALSAWMQSGHENMPELIVSPDHQDDLWAYLSTLKE